MNKLQIIVGFLIFILIIGGIIYYENTRERYRVDKLHWSEVMKEISSLDMNIKLLQYFGDFNSGLRFYYKGNYTRVLEFVRSRLYYERINDFVRYENPEIILFGPREFNIELEKFPARCGEYSIAYTALALAFEIKARLIVHMGQDHMWSEVYSEGQWIHVEPSDGIINDPLMYIRDRGKIIDADHPVLAFEVNGSIVDVSERYKI